MRIVEAISVEGNAALHDDRWQQQAQQVSGQTTVCARRLNLATRKLPFSSNNPHLGCVASPDVVLAISG